MEEKVRYEIVYFDNDTSWKIIDNKTKQEVGGINDMIKQLNRQDKRIRELEEENLSLQEQLRDLPKKIVGEIKRYDINVNKQKVSYTEYVIGLIECLDTILKKYGEEK